MQIILSRYYCLYSNLSKSSPIKPEILSIFVAPQKKNKIFVNYVLEVGENEETLWGVGNFYQKGVLICWGLRLWLKSTHKSREYWHSVSRMSLSSWLIADLDGRWQWDERAFQGEAPLLTYGLLKPLKHCVRNLSQ